MPLRMWKLNQSVTKQEVVSVEFQAHGRFLKGTATAIPIKTIGREDCPKNHTHRGRTHGAERLVTSSYVHSFGLASEDHSPSGRWPNESGNRLSTTGVTKNSLVVATTLSGWSIGGDRKGSSQQAKVDG